jgi:hypothetical protein
LCGFGLRPHRPPWPLAAHLSFNYRFSEELKHLCEQKATHGDLTEGPRPLGWVKPAGVYLWLRLGYS